MREVLVIFILKIFTFWSEVLDFTNPSQTYQTVVLFRPTVPTAKKFISAFSVTFTKKHCDHHLPFPTCLCCMCTVLSVGQRSTWANENVYLRTLSTYQQCAPYVLLVHCPPLTILLVLSDHCLLVCWNHTPVCPMGKGVTDFKIVSQHSVIALHQCGTRQFFLNLLFVKVKNRWRNF